MIPLSLSAICKAVSGRLLSAANSAGDLTSVCTNSKEVSPGCLFVALRGERFDAHDFLGEVAASGAAAAIVDREEKAAGIGIPCILVNDTRKALGHLAAYGRSLLTCRVLAVGGSNGKTTTKHLLGSVLSEQLSGTQSPKSFNNDIGVPLTILGSRPGDDYLILELGTNHPGELSPLSLMARPDVAIITSIGPEHLEGFGNIDGVRAEEITLLDGLTHDGLAIVNGDDRQLVQMARQRCKKIITFGFDAECDLVIETVRCSLDGISFQVRGETKEYRLPLPGRHNASNALAAIGAGREMGLSDGTIRQALANCSRPEMRMQLMHVGHFTIINDAYNANPASMLAALETLAAADVPGRRIAVLGEMRELGDCSVELHRQIGATAAKCGVALLVAVGQQAAPLAEEAVANGMGRDSVRWVPDADEAGRVISSLLQPQDTLLLKGSRGVRLEKVVEALRCSSVMSGMVRAS